LRLSQEKLAKIGSDLARLAGERPDLLTFRGDTRKLGRDLARFLEGDLRIEDEITQEALARLATYSRTVTPGTTEWELLLTKHKEEIAARRGYIL
jgi:hypothetical protein